MMYRGFEIDKRSAVGGTNISRDGEYVDHLTGSIADAKMVVDEILAEEALV